MYILIAIFLTFVLTAAWQILASRKIRANQQLMTQSLIKELNEMANKLGHADYLEYLAATKGKEYAAIAGANLKSFHDSFTAKGAN